MGAESGPQALGMGLAVPQCPASTQKQVSLPALCSGTAFRLVLPCSILSKPILAAKGWLRSPLGNGAAKHNTCSASKIGAQVSPALLSPHPRLPRTPYLQDEVAVGHPCLAGGDAGVEPSVGDSCLGDATSWSGAQGWGRDISSGSPTAPPRSPR